MKRRISIDGRNFIKIAGFKKRCMRCKKFFVSKSQEKICDVCRSGDGNEKEMDGLCEGVVC